MDYVLKTSYKMLRLQNCNNTKITLYINTCEMFFHINMKPSVFSRYLGWLMTEVGVARKLLLQLLLRILPSFIVTQILLNQHVNCLKSYYYFSLYCIATQILLHLYNLRIDVGWANFAVCWQYIHPELH